MNAVAETGGSITDSWYGVVLAFAVAGASAVGTPEPSSANCRIFESPWTPRYSALPLGANAANVAWVAEDAYDPAAVSAPPAPTEKTWTRGTVPPATEGT